MLRNSPVMCPHGAQLRKCGLCERDQRITELEAEVARWKQMFEDANEQRQELLRAKFSDPQHAELWERIKALEAEQAKLVRALRALAFKARVLGPDPEVPFRAELESDSWFVLTASGRVTLAIPADEAEAHEIAAALNAVAHHLAPKGDK